MLVIGYEAEMVKKAMGKGIEYVEQREQLGTGHALLCASDLLKNFQGNILVLVGDAPFLTGAILKKLIKHHEKKGAAATLMTTRIDPPPAYGRIIRNSKGQVLRIVEDRDATSDEKKITEVNTSHYCFRAGIVLPLLSEITTENNQGEYYLTDIIQLLVEKHHPVEAMVADDPQVLMGINSRVDLSHANDHLRKQILQHWMLSGVTIIDPSSVYIESGVTLKPDTVIHPFVYLSSNTRIGPNCTIGPHVKCVNAIIGSNSHIEFSVIENRKIDKDSLIGPFAYISGK
jgi:bifunctional UDP-N-acetylglucosamine pyrophosphorylase/glucosamine-1-phosphate N-acetyltransferase